MRTTVRPVFAYILMRYQSMCGRTHRVQNLIYEQKRIVLYDISISNSTNRRALCVGNMFESLIVRLGVKNALRSVLLRIVAA